jgi:hypothetical protein
MLCESRMGKDEAYKYVNQQLDNLQFFNQERRTPALAGKHPILPITDIIELVTLMNNDWNIPKIIIDLGIKLEVCIWIYLSFPYSLFPISHIVSHQVQHHQQEGDSVE